MNANQGSERSSIRTRLTPDQILELTERVKSCRIGTLNRRGVHLTVTGYVWDGSFVWIPSNVRTQRNVDIGRDPRMTVLVDGSIGESDGGTTVGFVEFIGRAEIVGEVPRTGQPNPELEAVEKLFVESTNTPIEWIHDGPDGKRGGHVWIRLTPERIVGNVFRVPGHKPA